MQFRALDDLQLRDGLPLGPEGIAQTWSDMLAYTHQRGERLTHIVKPNNQALRIPSAHKLGDWYLVKGTRRNWATRLILSACNAHRQHV
jgi:hypothetical protein